MKPVLWTADDILQATGGRWIAGDAGNVAATGVCYYLRQARKGDLFLVSTPQHWGSSYLDTSTALSTLAAWGVAAVLVDRKPDAPPESLPLVLVEDTRQALDALGRFARDRLKGKVVCITGSVGKSTTKEMLRFMLGQQAPTVGSNLNFNHGPGVPLSLAQTHPDTAYGVYEFAVDLPSVTLSKARIARPHVAVITDIQHDHLMYYHTLEALADQKALLFDALESGGTAILNRDNALFRRLESAASAKGVGRIVSFGMHPHADVRASLSLLDAEGSTVEALVHGTPVTYRLKQPGRHVIMNSLAALAAVAALGADIRKAAASLQKFPGLEQRTQRHRIVLGEGYFDLLDDAFSANPASMRAGLDVLGLMPVGPGGRRLAVLGEIRELGSDSATIHASLAAAVLDAGIDRLFTIGEDMKYLREALPAHLLGPHERDGAALAKAVVAEVQPGDIVLIKGSRHTPELFSPVISALLTMGKEETERTEANPQ